MSENENNTTPEEEGDGTTEATEAEATSTDDAGATGAAAEATASDNGADTRGMTVSHAIGVSRPEDKFTSPGSDDARTREELEKLGVEPDSGGIDPVLLASLVGVVVLTVAAWIFSTQLFEFAGKKQVENTFEQASYPMLTEVRETAREHLTTYAELEGDDDGLYRIPIEVAFDVLVENSDLLAAHPAGAPVDRDLPEGIDMPTLRTPAIPSEARPSIQLGNPADRVELDLGVQGSAGQGGNRIGLTATGNAEGGAAAIQLQAGGNVEDVDGTPTAVGTAPVEVGGAGVDTAGNPPEGDTAPPADDPTANPAGTDQ